MLRGDADFDWCGIGGIAKAIAAPVASGVSTGQTDPRFAHSLIIVAVPVSPHPALVVVILTVTLPPLQNVVGFDAFSELPDESEMPLVVDAFTSNCPLAVFAKLIPMTT